MLDEPPRVGRRHDHRRGLEVVKQYRELLGKLGLPFPSPFILQDVLDAHPDVSGTTAEAKGK